MRTAKIEKSIYHLHRIVAVFACLLLLLVSAYLPFLTASYSNIIEDNFDITYWSYKSRILSLRWYGGGLEELWFGTYWFAESEDPYSYLPPSTLNISWVLIVTFLMQVLTIALGSVALFLKRKLAKLLPAISCLFVVLLMAYVGIQVQRQTYSLLKHELGFWLCFLAALLFLVAFLLHLKSERSPS